MLKSFPFESGEPIVADLELASGTISVNRCGGDALEVKLEPLGRHRDRADESIERATVTFEGRRLVVHVPGRIRDVPLLMRVAIPEGSRVVARTASADLACDLDLGGLEVKSASGDVLGRNVGGDVSVQTASGDLRVAKVAGRLSVRTASGDARAESVAGDVEVATASGDVLLGEAGSARIRTASGAVEISSVAAGVLSVNTASGDVTVGVAPGRGVWLDLTTVSGETTCSLPSEPATAAGADVRLSCKTVSGDVEVRSARAAS